MKFCTYCNEQQPLDHWGIKNKATGKRLSWCKVRYRDAHRIRYQTGAQPLLSPKPVEVERQCSVCGQTKLKECFRPQRRTCRDCEREAARLEREQHPERVKARLAKHERLHHDRRKQRARERYRADPVRYGLVKLHLWREKNRESVRSTTKRWRAKNPESVAVYNSRRRYRIYANGGSFTKSDWAALKRKYDFMCLGCKKREPEVTLVPDHVIPLALGGSNGISNRQPLCKLCNEKKYTGTIDLRPLTQAAFTL